MTTATTDTDTSPRILAGIAYLDAIHPGWATKINTKTLAMGSNHLCILGQLAGDAPDLGYSLVPSLVAYDAEHGDLGHGHSDATTSLYGFTSEDDVSADDWRRVIQTRT